MQPTRCWSFAKQDTKLDSRRSSLLQRRQMQIPPLTEQKEEINVLRIEE